MRKVLILGVAAAWMFSAAADARGHRSKDFSDRGRGQSD